MSNVQNDELTQERRRIIRELEKLRDRAVDACVGPARSTPKSKEQAKVAYAFAQGIIAAIGIVAMIPIAEEGVDFNIQPGAVDGMSKGDTLPVTGEGNVIQ